MLFPLKSAAAHWRAFIDVMMSPISPKNLRLSAILIALKKLIIAHALLFLVLLGLAHAEQMKTMLAMDIQDQKEVQDRYGYYDTTPFRNQIPLRTASQLVSVTEMLLYILTAVAAIYLLSTLSLFAGIFKSRSEFVLPWLVVEFIFLVSAAVLVFWLQNEQFVAVMGGKLYYFTMSFTILIFNCLMWYVVHSFYQSLRTMNKLREIATVAIPCPPPGAVPFQFRRENMYLGSNGYKHILTESPDGPY